MLPTLISSEIDCSISEIGDSRSQLKITDCKSKCALKMGLTTANSRSHSVGSSSWKPLTLRTLRNDPWHHVKKAVSWADECGGSLSYFIEETDLMIGSLPSFEEDDSEHESKKNDNETTDNNYFSFNEDLLDDAVFENDHVINTEIRSPDHLYPVHPLDSAKRNWVLNFKQPESNYLLFRNQLEINNVGLECSSMKNDHLSGTVKVKNIEFDKEVTIRITADNWLTFTDHQCTYKPFKTLFALNSENYYRHVNYLAYFPRRKDSAEIFQPKNYDSFEFDLDLNALLDPEKYDRIYFCIRYRVSSGAEYWDNNNGSNYAILSKKYVISPNKQWPKRKSFCQKTANGSNVFPTFLVSLRLKPNGNTLTCTLSDLNKLYTDLKRNDMINNHNNHLSTRHSTPLVIKHSG